MFSETFYSSESEMAQALASSIADDLEHALDEKGKGFLILPGGSSPKLLMKELAKQELDWDRVDVTTSDERVVPFEDDESNAGQVSRIMGVEPIWLCEDASDELLFPSDVCVLGMGADGHFASLFPGYPFFEGEGIIEAEAPFEPRGRLSWTLESLIDTKRVVFLVSGREKKDVCQRALQGSAPDLPISVLFEKCKEKLEFHVWGV